MYRWSTIIIFSERCTLKDVTVNSEDQKVIKRDYVRKTVNQTIETHSLVLSKESIDELFAQLYPLTQADAETKAKHIEQIQMHTHKKSTHNKIPME